MVRLKGKTNPGTTRTTTISIPYGSIKRRGMSFDSPTHKAISIPYGSIKSTE